MRSISYQIPVIRSNGCRPIHVYEIIPRVFTIMNTLNIFSIPGRRMRACRQPRVPFRVRQCITAFRSRYVLVPLLNFWSAVCPRTVLIYVYIPLLFLSVHRKKQNEIFQLAHAYLILSFIPKHHSPPFHRKHTCRPDVHRNREVLALSRMEYAVEQFS